MRFVVALVIGFVLTPALASATQQEPTSETLQVSVVRVADVGDFVTWSPAPGARVYEVYSGPSLEELTLMATTPLHSFHAMGAELEEDVWYVVATQSPDPSAPDQVSDMRGKCIATRGMSGVAITVANCMPAEGPP
jgi:hypothetical protein